jgi:hypothetical protein
MTFKSMQNVSPAMEPNSPQHSIEPVDAYYQQLTPFEQRTCDIARDHLGSSFDLARSNGFLRWLSKNR